MAVAKVTKAKEILELPYITFGCDPEFFLEKDGKIIGAEKVVPKEGLHGRLQYGHVIIDGVQAEINTTQNSGCRASTATAIKEAFDALRRRLVGIPGIKPNFSTVVEISKTELDSLSESCKVFGCAPSKNLYNQEAKVEVDASVYLKRSGGGHIHLGGVSCRDDERAKRYVRVLDIMVGNTCVLMDRDPYAPERRKNYGRAGEFRTPKHGLEYRTLSNFWLQAFPLTSFVLGMCRMAIGVVNRGLNSAGTVRPRMVPIGQYDDWYGIDGVPYQPWNAEKELLDSCDLSKVEKAINTNNLELAKETWEVVKGFIERHVPQGSASFNIYTGATLLNGAMPAFEFFVEKVQKEGFKFWFPEDPFDHWNLLVDGHYCGWENFLTQIVTPKFKVAKEGGEVKAVTLDEAQKFVSRITEYPSAKVSPPRY